MRRFQVGDVLITRIKESCGPVFAPELLYPDWDPAVLEEYRSLLIPMCFNEAEQKFIASYHSWLVETKHHTILIDTCAGNHKKRPALPRFNQLATPYLERLESAGVRPEDVDYVFCTHLHVDHCGWNTRLENGRWVPTFPNARYLFSETEKEFWESRAEDAGLHANVYNDSVLPVIEAGRASILKVAEDLQLGDALQAFATPGHTPGQLCLQLGSHGEEAVFSADTMHQPIQVYRPDWNSRFCENADDARRSRRFLLEHCAERHALVLPAHFAGSYAGHVQRAADGFSWEFSS